MKSYQFFTADGRGGTMLCDDETLADAVAELSQRFANVIKVQIGKEQWLADQPSQTDAEHTKANFSKPEIAESSGVSVEH